MTASVEQYYEQIRLALNNFDDPAWLGHESPLAAPYFLGDLLPTADASPFGRGEALRQALFQAADRLWAGSLPANHEELDGAVNEERRQMGNKGLRYAYLLLELRYFRRYFRPLLFPKPTQEADIREYLGVGRGPYFNHLKTARQLLGDALLELARPALRLERPPHPRHRLIGRDDLLPDLLAHLRAGQSVALSGPSGTGKTTLSAVICQHWSPATAVFWYTLRPTINDQIESLLFALGVFCHQQGASNLWRQLVADGGQIANRDVALAHLRADLHDLPQPPLLCFDELDHLQSPPEEMTAAQQAWIELLGDLRQHCPLLFIGQQRVLTADHAYRLEGLTEKEMAVLLRERGLQTYPADLQTVQRYTGGNPRLLQLCLTLAIGVSTIGDLLPQLPEQPILHLIFERVWQRLTVDQRAAAQQLAVFPAPAPLDAWHGDQRPVLDDLADQRIALYDEVGGVELLPLYRELIAGDRHRLPAEIADQCHMQAALIRAERAEFTAAAHHLIAAGEVEAAIALWYAERQREIRRGQGPSALPMFAQLSQRRLPDEQAEQLGLIRAELYTLLGQPGDGLRELESQTWQTDSLRELEANRLKGQLLGELGNVDEAFSVYEQSLTTVSRLLREQSRLHEMRGLAFIRQRALHEAWTEALQAHYSALMLLAQVLDEQGKFQDALTHYHHCLEIAAQLNDSARQARVHHNLVACHARRGAHIDALHNGELAAQLFRAQGDRFSGEKLNSLLTAIHLNREAYADVIAIGEPALAYFERAHLDYWASIIV
jgi:tetratricopeptide (TPR) repeat protein